ncbi:MAG: hypothetical protein A2Y32_14915 [Spirochaetes bacterium GWF1_60_12]|nr:MAG: hypothetical protein A2Y32_14915 [Spirochaetes bacterium GWF1_60_12]
MNRNRTALITISLIVGLVLSLASCANNTPGSVTLRFMQALSTMDFDTAASLGTDSTKQLVEMISTIAASAGEAGIQEQIGTNFKVISTSITGETATVILSSDGEEQPIALRKVNGQWKVDLSKDNMDKDF